MLLWPISSLTAVMLTPAITSRDANAWRKSCQVNSRIPASAIAFPNQWREFSNPPNTKLLRSILGKVVFEGLPGPKRRLQCKKNSRGKFEAGEICRHDRRNRRPPRRHSPAGKYSVRDER